MIIYDYLNGDTPIIMEQPSSLNLSEIATVMGGGPRVVVSSIVGSLRDREVACSALDRQGSNFESCSNGEMTVSSHHPQEVLLAQFSLYVHKGDLKPDSFHFINCHAW